MQGWRRYGRCRKKPGHCFQGRYSGWTWQGRSRDANSRVEFPVRLLNLRRSSQRSGTGVLIMLEAQITAVAQQFAREAIKLENLKAGSNAAIELSVRMPSSSYIDNKSPKIEISCRFWSGNEGCTVTAGSLGALMD